MWIEPLVQFIVALALHGATLDQIVVLVFQRYRQCFVVGTVLSQVGIQNRIALLDMRFHFGIDFPFLAVVERQSTGVGTGMAGGDEQHARQNENQFLHGVMIFLR